MKIEAVKVREDANAVIVSTGTDLEQTVKRVGIAMTAIMTEFRNIIRRRVIIDLLVVVTALSVLGLFAVQVFKLL